MIETIIAQGVEVVVWFTIGFATPSLLIGFAIGELAHKGTQ